MDYVPDYLRVYHCIYVFQVTSAYTNASTLYTNVPLLDGLCSRLPQRIPMHLRYTLTVPEVRFTMFQVTSAYTNASTLYSESSSVRWTMFQVTSAYTNASTLYSESSSVRLTKFQVTSSYTNASTLYSE